MDITFQYTSTLGSPVNILNVQIKGQLVYSFSDFMELGSTFLYSPYSGIWYACTVTISSFLIICVVCKQTVGIVGSALYSSMWLNQKTNHNGNFDKINMFIFPKLGKQYYIWKMYVEFKLSKELSKVYFLSSLPKHYQE